MGNVYMHGGVVNTMEVQGDCKQRGGIIRRIQQSGEQSTYQQPEPKVIYRDRVVFKDRVVYKDRKIFCDNPSLSVEIDNLKRENEKLRQALKERDEQQPSDDILISKIRRLENQLAKECEEYKKKIDELEWRLESVTDIANGHNEHFYEYNTNANSVEVSDVSFDVLFTLINEYPISHDADMAEELGISVSTLRYIAKVLRLSKSPEARREARERLKRHGIEMIERRGGDQTKDKREKQKKTNKKQK